MIRKIFFALILLFITSGFTTHFNDTTKVVNLPWSTTFDCPDWLKYSDPLTCDELSKGGNSTCSGGEWEQITSVANYPGGAGAKGQRHWLGDGVSNNSGGILINLNNETEFWMRWYMRFEAGFQWSSYEGFKIIYLFDSTGGLRNNSYFMMPGATGTPSRSIDLYCEGDSKHYVANRVGWLNQFPSGRSDGSWHCYEVHFKRESAGQSNGVFQAWLDSVLIINANTVNYGIANSRDTFIQIRIGSNSKVPNNGRCMYVDYDDIAISNTGYIGPIGSGSAPASPRGL